MMMFDEVFLTIFSMLFSDDHHSDDYYTHIICFLFVPPYYSQMTITHASYERGPLIVFKHQMPNFINFLATSAVAIIIIVVIFITCKSLRHLYLSIPPLSGQWSSSLHKMKQLTLSLSLILLKHEMPDCDDGYRSHIPRWEGNCGERKEKVDYLGSMQNLQWWNSTKEESFL